MRSLWGFVLDVVLNPRKGDLIPRVDDAPVRPRFEGNDLANLHGCPNNCCNGGSLADPHYRPGRGSE